MQTRRDRQAGWRAKGRDDPVSQRQVRLAAGLVEFIEAQRGLAKVRDNKIIIRRDWKKESDKFKGAFAIARDLAEKVIAEKKAVKAV